MTKGVLLVVIVCIMLGSGSALLLMMIDSIIHGFYAFGALLAVPALVIGSMRLAAYILNRVEYP